MTESVSSELNNVEKKIQEGKYEAAFQRLNDIEQNETLTVEERLEIRSYKGFLYFFLGQFETALKVIEQLYQESQEIKTIVYRVDALTARSAILCLSDKWDDYYKCINELKNLFKSIPQEDSAQYHKREAFFLFAICYKEYFNNKFNLTLDNADRCLKICKHFYPLFPFYPSILEAMAHSYRRKGELNRALKYTNEALSQIPKGEYYYQLKLKGGLYRNMGEIYYEKGELNRALEYHLLSLDNYEKIEKEIARAVTFYHIISILLIKKENELVQTYLQKFKKYNEETDYVLGKIYYQLSQALILKSSARMRDRVKAEHILKGIIEDGESGLTVNLALINLCDWYFKEFQISNQIEVLDDIFTLIDHLQKNATRENSYSTLANVKLLQAKLALLQINMVDARKLLAEAQKIADEHGLQLLANVISKEHDKLLEELKLWESIKKTKTTISERLKLVSIDDVIDRLQGKKAVEPIESTNEQPVLLIIIGEGGALVFSYPFTDIWQKDEDLFSNFLSAFSSFSDEFFSQGLDRAKFGEDTILMQPVNSFSVCYLFKGQTYLAKQRLEKFIKTVQSNSSIWETLERGYNSSQVLEITDIPKMKNLLTEIFKS